MRETSATSNNSFSDDHKLNFFAVEVRQAGEEEEKEVNEKWKRQQKDEDYDDNHHR